jgi:hypothetical protein
MQNGAQTKIPALSGSGRLLGFVRVLVGSQVFQLPVEAVTFEQDGDRAAGGFFDHEGQLGILVDEAATPSDVQAQIESATAEAVRFLSKKVLN